VLFAITAHEITSARLATIVLWVNLLAVEDDIFSHDGLFAECAKLVLRLTDLIADCLALQAERIALVFLILDTKKASTTLGASKMFWVINSVLETDALVNDGLLATIATLAKQVIEAILAINISLLFHELFCFEDLTVAVSALEALRMILLIANSEHTANN